MIMAHYEEYYKLKYQGIQFTFNLTLNRVPKHKFLQNRYNNAKRTSASELKAIMTPENSQIKPNITPNLSRTPTRDSQSTRTAAASEFPFRAETASRRFSVTPA